MATLLALSGAAGSVAAFALEPTHETHTGPWYVPGAPQASNLWRPGDPGQRLQVNGRLLDTRGAPVAAALVEFWHADAGGQYGDATYRASLRTDRHGKFAFRSVLPGHRSAERARHIHFVVTHPEHRELVTRIYFRGDRNFAAAIDPELGITLEQGSVDGQAILFGEVQFVLQPN